MSEKVEEQEIQIETKTSCYISRITFKRISIRSCQE